MSTIAEKIPNARWLRMIPVCLFVNIFYFMDRQVISMAMPGGMMKDLAMNATLAGFAIGITAVGLLFLQVQSGFLAQKGKAKTIVGVSILCWSVLSLLTAFVQEAWQLYVVRFLLGLVEGPVMPAMMMLFTFWFPDKDGERNRANSCYFTGNIAGMVLMGPLAGGLIATQGWRTLFIVLGGISFLCYLAWTLFITDRPENAKWLSKKEKDYIINTLKAEDDEVKSKFAVDLKDDKLPLKALLTNKNVWLLIFISICSNLPMFGFLMWLPTIIKNITSTGILAVGLLSVIPNLATLLGLWTWSYIAKKTNDRRLCTGLPPVLFVSILVIGTFLPKDPFIGFGALCLAAFFAMGGAPAFSTIPSLILIREMDGPTRGLIGVASGIGAFVGPYLVGYLITVFNGSTNVGMYALAVVGVCTIFLCYALPKTLSPGKAEIAGNANTTV